eukprot:scaffold2722_cov233-Pinguiococcus_pyrenoidosus.AAC.6
MRAPFSIRIRSVFWTRRMICRSRSLFLPCVTSPGMGPWCRCPAAGEWSEGSAGYSWPALSQPGAPLSGLAKWAPACPASRYCDNDDVGGPSALPSLGGTLPLARALVSNGTSCLEGKGFVGPTSANRLPDASTPRGTEDKNARWDDGDRAPEPRSSAGCASLRPKA